MTTVPAILLGGRETAVPVARSLAAAGVPVHAVGRREDPLRYSRACATYTIVDGADVQPAWLQWLAERRERGVILPSCDDALELVAGHRAELVARGHLPFEADDEAVRAMLDKDLTYELARRGGIPTPASVTVRCTQDIALALERLELPCGVKPLVSHRFVQATGITEKVLVARDGGELERLLRLGLDAGTALMATEIIPGPDDSLYWFLTYVTSDGRVLFELSNRKLRQDPPHFGVGCYVVAEHDPEVVEVGLRFVRAAGLVGPAQVEFKRDARDGRLKLIECNHRFHLCVQLVRLCGIDVPRIAYERALGREVAVAQPRYGARLWHPASDLRALRQSRRAGELRLGAWAKSLLHRQHFTVWSATDPLPSLVDHARLARRLAAKRLRARHA